MVSDIAKIECSIGSLDYAERLIQTCLGGGSTVPGKAFFASTRKDVRTIFSTEQCTAREEKKKQNSAHLTISCNGWRKNDNEMFRVQETSRQEEVK